MALQTVSLLTALLVTSAWGQFPNLFSTGFPPASVLQNNQQQAEANLLTCISADAQDPRSQIRMTLKPLNHQPMGGRSGLGLGLMGHDDDDLDQDWIINGIMLPSGLVQKAGTYRLAVFRGGRTFGECKASALGQVLSTGGGNPLLSAMRTGAFSPFTPFMHPLLAAPQQAANGEASNNVVVSTGTTMYSGIIRQVMTVVYRSWQWFTGHGSGYQIAICSLQGMLLV
ncbi:uncharacterized protein LOC143288230 [Babylonia areolata]|uniref:uncharacterized protein LOC143288230 n=1 Tax=Babylonia areolata TaxID=304850 RepID=UPI003FD25DE7